jgi:3'-phosphoadenosine 5'-phosphosulfate sulfotransferase
MRRNEIRDNIARILRKFKMRLSFVRSVEEIRREILLIGKDEQDKPVV